jgi:N-acetylglucosamine-6-phosphate deacetylase
MEKNKLLLKGRIVSPEGISHGVEALEISDGIINVIGYPDEVFSGLDYTIYDFGPNYICPGFIDMHVHGSGGVDVMDATPIALETLSVKLAQGGTTGFLATTMSAPHKELINVIKNIRWVKQNGTEGAHIIGAQLEGPYLNMGKRGAHREECLRLPNVKELKEYVDTGRGVIRMITIAPELPGAIGVIEYAASLGIVVSLGHTDASITQVNEAGRAGLSHVTHAFNAMAGLHHRDPGTIGAILSMKNLSADIIVDGVHVHPNVVKIFVHSKGINNVCVITDSNRVGGMGDGVYELGGQKIIVRNGVSFLEDGVMTGSTLSMAGTVKNLVQKVGLSVEEAVRLASTNPARILKLDSKGVLAPGKDADLVVLNHDFEVLMTVVGGKIVYEDGGFHE